MPDGLRDLVSAYIRAFRDSIEFCDWPEERLEEQARQDLEGFFADLFLAESMLHHVRHEIWRREELGAFVPDERASLEAELERWRAQVGTLESRARREGMEAVVPLLRRHRR